MDADGVYTEPFGNPQGELSECADCQDREREATASAN